MKDDAMTMREDAVKKLLDDYALGELRREAEGARSVSLTSGDVWLRLVVTPSYAAAYYGTGSGSTAPTSWTLVTSTSTVVATLAAGRLSRVGLHAGRTSSGSGTYTVEWRDVQTRLLGLSP